MSLTDSKHNGNSNWSTHKHDESRQQFRILQDWANMANSAQELLKKNHFLFHQFCIWLLESLLGWCSFAQSLGHVLIGQFNLSVCRTGVGEFITCIGILQVPPNSTKLWWNIKVTVFLGNHLNVGRKVMMKRNWYSPNK